MYTVRKGIYYITCEYVSPGHPDKIADQISDGILDLYLNYDNNARVAVETMVTTDTVIIAGECRSKSKPSEDQIDRTIRKIVKDIGYEEQGFNWKTLVIINKIHEQSANIADCVDKKYSIGAGDQGIMYGFATNETSEFMPATIHWAREILYKLKQAVNENRVIKFGPDAKTQLTVMYNDGRPQSISNVVLSAKHPVDADTTLIKQQLKEIITSAVPTNEYTQFYINPAGKFIIGGPNGDCGLTGRKLMIDTYGGYIPHGGGAFSGKDASKVDRTGAYMARYIAKNIVASGLMSNALVQLAYAIGIDKPVSFDINDFGTSKVAMQDILKFIKDNIDMTPYGMIKKFGMSAPIYTATSAYGHFGRKDQSFPWEAINDKSGLKALLIKKFSLS